MGHYLECLIGLNRCSAGWWWVTWCCEVCDLKSYRVDTSKRPDEWTCPSPDAGCGGDDDCLISLVHCIPNTAQVWLFWLGRCQGHKTKHCNGGDNPLAMPHKNTIFLDLILDRTLTVLYSARCVWRLLGVRGMAFDIGCHDLCDPCRSRFC